VSRRERTIAFLQQLAGRVLSQVQAGKLPELRVPTRSLSNVSYDPARGHFELGPQVKQRGLTVHAARTFAQTLKMMALSRELAEGDDFATKREAYYISKNWGDCRFDGQDESDAIMSDLEAMAAAEDITREQLGFYPEAHGGAIVGQLTVIDRSDPQQVVRIDCRQLGQGSYAVPRTLERVEFSTDAHFVLAIETGGMFQRLHQHRFWEQHPCVLVEMAGVPTRATRRFVRRLSEEHALPVYCFTDCDPYGFANIYRTLKVGSGNAAHTARLYSVPSARFLGVTPDDIEEYGLQDATHPLSEIDIKRARDALEHDPFFRAHPPWVRAIEKQLSLGVRAEQQALAKWGLNFVIEQYLPRKLQDPMTFLP
jgi:DNA topoisomerase VI subunit A